MTARDTVKGKSRAAKGRMKQMFGRATDDRSLETKGIGDQLAGRARQAIGRVKTAMREPRH